MKKIISIIILVLTAFSSLNSTQQDAYIDLGIRRLTSYSTTEIEGPYRVENRISIVLNYTSLDFPYEGLSTHIEVNTLLLEDLMITFDYDLVTMSSLSPIIILRVDTFTSEIIEELNRIASDDLVKALFKYKEETPMQTFSSGFEFEGDPGDGGSGGSNPPDPEREVVRVGIVDRYLSYGATCEYIHTGDPSEFRKELGHEGAVVRILETNFDNYQQYLEVCYSSVLESAGSVITAINGLISLDVDLIVIAVGFIYSEYDENSYHIDYISWNYGVTIVSSSGNRGLQSEGGDSLVAHTATSYNGISVGGITEDYDFWEGSSYIYTNNDINKPNIVDTVTPPPDWPRGTSFSAPRVAAKIAMFLSYYPEYKRDHIAISSFIHASALKSHINVQDNIVHSSGLTNKLGAGIIDLVLLYDIANNNDYHRITPTENPTSLPLTLLNFNIYIPLDYKVQISLSSIYRNCDSGGFNPRTEDRTEYDIILLDNQNNEIKNIVSQSNILHLTYHNDIAYGLFTVVIRQKTPSICHNSDSEIVVSYTTVAV